MYNLLMKFLILIITGIILISTTVHAAIQPAQPAVGVPLDGGLLAVLAGAGIAYFAKRKKRLEK